MNILSILGVIITSTSTTNFNNYNFEEDYRRITNSSTSSIIPTDFVQTPNGSKVLVLTDVAPLTGDEIEHYTELYQYYFPNNVILSEATSDYNCHSYAWYSRSTMKIIIG